MPAWSATTFTPIATAVYEARCEVSSKSINGPIQMSISSCGGFLAVPSVGGYKNRTPVLHYYLLDEETRDNFPAEHFMKVGLSEIAYHSTTDEARKLIFIGDSCRVKSYSWASALGASNNTGIYKQLLPTHTLKSSAYEGPMAILPNGRLIRAVKGLAGVWNIDVLPTHGPDGQEHIGRSFNIDDSWRDDFEDIECSAGSTSNRTIKFEDPKYMPTRWKNHPSAPGVMLCASGGSKSKNRSCASLDIEHGGKTVTRYLGHDGTIEDISTYSDPKVFVTACSDGFARMYDARHPLPTLTFGEDEQTCSAVLIADPDGIPTMFIGTESSVKVQMWDVRARTAVYDLATGNNAVNAMAWDASRNSLYAATECTYADGAGNYYGYRRAKIPQSSRTVNGDNEGIEGYNDEDDEDDDNEDDDEGEDDEDDEDYECRSKKARYSGLLFDEDDDDDDDDYRCWPEEAHHNEDYFGYTFDAGEHRIYRYAFKEDADNQVLPPYGDATRR